MPKVMEGVSKEQSDIHEVIIMLVIQIRKKYIIIVKEMIYMKSVI